MNAAPLIRWISDRSTLRSGRIRTAINIAKRSTYFIDDWMAGDGAHCGGHLESVDRVSAVTAGGTHSCSNKQCKQRLGVHHHVIKQLSESILMYYFRPFAWFNTFLRVSGDGAVGTQPRVFWVLTPEACGCSSHVVIVASRDWHDMHRSVTSYQMSTSGRNIEKSRLLAGTREDTRIKTPSDKELFG